MSKANNGLQSSQYNVTSASATWSTFRSARLHRFGNTGTEPPSAALGVLVRVCSAFVPRRECELIRNDAQGGRRKRPLTIADFSVCSRARPIFRYKEDRAVLHDPAMTGFSGDSSILTTAFAARCVGMNRSVSR